MTTAPKNSIHSREPSTTRRNSRPIFLGSVKVGGDAPITVQTMTKTDTRDIDATRNDIKRLAVAGCEIIRLAVPDEEAARALAAIVPGMPIPIIADIHFDHKLALIALDGGVQGLRINPGNLRSAEKIREVAHAARAHGVPIRIGVNAGSLDPELRTSHGGVTAIALAESALREAEQLEREGFTNIKIAVKAFDLPIMIEATRIVAARSPYPLHLGVTESGLPDEGVIRSSIGIGTLLLSGIGDTIRVSLTGDSAEEIAAAIRILRVTGLRTTGPVIVSCPTCGRCRIPLVEIAREVSARVSHLKEPLRIAVMGCAVNGPGEAREADFGIAGGRENGLVFRKGQIVRTLPADELVTGLLEEIRASLGKKNSE
ncbi:MAG: flavodoxin-dependent (E)-4-hydroxy-3-methylbut-2-enyl-diphosphate synthase [Candidatus Riflebacteria bacterium]|nr:flavodoxin-dependent (E)-4-hydroxy-3-methylbut-2-enyl-diphosphate synthase [Candidatus Riflebacteria bacterium]